MQPQAYQQFTQALQKQLMVDERVMALIALGSLAEPECYDQWSDHDFWVITQTDCQEALLSDLTWLPNADEIVMAFRQAVSYYTVFYRSGHTIEFAVFDTEQMVRAKTNRYSIFTAVVGVPPALS